MVARDGIVRRDGMVARDGVVTRNDMVARVGVVYAYHCCASATCLPPKKVISADLRPPRRLRR